MYNRESSTIAALGVLLIQLLFLLPASAAEAESAWEALIRERPEMAEETWTPLERQVLSILTPEQGRDFLSGVDPSTLELQSGETLAQFIENYPKAIGTGELTYHPIEACLVLATGASVDGVMTANETRELLVRGETTDLSAQGGSSTGCGIPVGAEAVLLNVQLVSASNTGRLKAWASDLPEPGDVLIEYKVTSDKYKPTNASIVDLCAGAVCPSDFKLLTAGAAANVRIYALGYFAPADRHSLDASDGSPSDVVFVDDLGNVGVGTTTPFERLTVVGDVSASGTVCDVVGCIGTADWPDITNKPAEFPPTGVRSGDFDILGALQVGSASQTGRIDVFGSGINYFLTTGQHIGELRTNGENDFVIQPQTGKLRAQSDLYLQFATGSSWRDLYAGEVRVHDDVIFQDDGGVTRGRFSRSGNDVEYFDGTGDGQFRVRDRLHVTGGDDVFLTFGSTITEYIQFKEGASQIRDLNIQLGTASDGVLRVEGALSVDRAINIGQTLAVSGDADIYGNLTMHPVPTGASSGTVCYQDTVFGDIIIKCSSSRRYKKNVSDYLFGLEEVEMMRPVTFEWRSNGQLDVGFIAEEVEEVDPRLVTYDDGRVEGVKYSRITALLVNAIKEQQAQIEKLQAAVCSLSPEAEWCE